MGQRLTLSAGENDQKGENSEKGKKGANFLGIRVKGTCILVIHFTIISELSCELIDNKYLCDALKVHRPNTERYNFNYSNSDSFHD